MLPVNTGGHSTYQNFVVENLRKYYPNPDALSRSTWDIIDRFWNLDLSYTDELMRSRYSVFGPRPRTPSCMQRSYLLSIDFKVTLLTDWAAQLKINPLYAILSGFEVGDTPGVGTFYVDCQHFFRQIFLGYFPDIVQAFDTLGRNVYGDDYTSLHNPIVLSSVLLVYGMFHSTQILF